MVGEGEDVTDPAEIERLEDLELEPWDRPGLRTHWVNIRRTRSPDAGSWTAKNGGCANRTSLAEPSTLVAPPAASGA
jgi:hypothetical protein